MNLSLSGGWRGVHAEREVGDHVSEELVAHVASGDQLIGGHSAKADSHVKRVVSDGASFHGVVYSGGRVNDDRADRRGGVQVRGDIHFALIAVVVRLGGDHD